MNNHILIVEDSPTQAEQLKLSLQAHGYEVTVAANGAEALEKARRDPPDMIITDTLMPVMDGFTLCREWEKDEVLKAIPFVFYTATYTDPEDQELALSLGAERFIIKPAEPDVLTDILRQVVEGRKAGRLAASRQSLEEEQVYLRQYNEALIRKLEDKMMQLEETNRALERDIIERKRVEDRVEHLNLVLRAIRSVNQLITREKDRDRLLQGVCDNLIETRGYHNAWSALFDESGELVATAEAGLGEEFTLLIERLKRGELTACGRRALSQPGVVVTEDPLAACVDCPLAANYGGRGAMTIRLEHDGKVYGLLSAVIPAHLTADREEQALFGEVARDIAFALHDIELEDERQRAEEEVRRHLERVEALREIDRAITSTLDLSGRLDIILGELKRVIPYHSASIFLLSDGTAKLTAGRGFPDLERVLQVSFPVKEDPLTRELMQEKRPLVLADAQADERFLARGGTEYVRSWIGVPLIARGEAIGFLTVDHREPDVYGEESAEIAQSFASQAAIAIENARLYDASQRRAEEMAALREVNLATLSTLERDQVFETMLDQLGTVIDHDTAAIKIITPDGSDKMIAGRGPIIYDQAMWNGFDVKDNKLVQEMKETGRPVVVHDAHTDERYKKIGDWKAFHSWAGAPLFVRGDMIGYLAVEKASPGFYDENAVQLLGDFAHAAAIALENARLYEDIQRELAERKRAEEALRESEVHYRELADSITDIFFAFDRDLRYTYWNRASEELTGILEKDAIGKSLYDLFPDTPQTRQAEGAYRDVLRTQQPQTFVNEYQLGDKDFFFEISAYPSRDGLSVFIKDISERKRVEEATHAIGERYRSYIEVTEQLAWTTNAAGEVEEDIPSWRKYTGQSYAEVKGLGWTKALHPDDAEHATEVWEKAVETKSAYEVEYRVKRYDGVYRYFLARGVPVPREDGSIREWVGTCIDITERKQTEVALRDSEQKYRLLAENSTDVISIVDMNLRYTYLSPSVTRLRGYTPEEALAQTQQETMTPASFEIVKKVFQEEIAIENSKDKDPDRTRLLELELTCKDGSTVWTETNNSFIRDKDGRAIGIIGVTRNITERKQAEEALRESEGKYRALFEGSAEGIFVADIETREFKYANPAMSKMLGYTEGELKRMGVVDIHPKDALEHVVSEFEAQARGEKTLAPNIPCLRKDGTIIYADVNTTGVLIDGRECNVGFFTDVTERVWAQEELRQSFEKLRRALEGTVNCLASAIEMRDPYTAGHQQRVTQLACAIAEEMGLPEEQIEGLRMAGLIHDIGKINVPAEILSKPGPLTEIEFGLIKMHPQSGYDVLNEGIDFPWPVAQIVLQHHERMDGSGYPQGLSGEEIIPEARILSVADVVEAMASHRPYRPSRGIDKALEEISQNRGALYDPEVVDACLKLFAEKGFEFE